MKWGPGPVYSARVIADLADSALDWAQVRTHVGTNDVPRGT